MIGSSAYAEHRGGEALTSRMFIRACRAVNYRVILTQLGWGGTRAAN